MRLRCITTKVGGRYSPNELQRIAF
jgi:hypothetical protein